MVWTAPLYSVQEVNAAGRILVASQTDDGEWWHENFLQYLDALDVINNWRGSHAYPLNTFQINLRSTAKRFDARPLVAQRVKRMISISNKLQIQKSMKLSQMQDLGGCRAILSNVASVKDVVNYYHKKSSIKHILASSDDYINTPKRSGYRGMHLVYRYHSDKNKDIYNGLKIEMQIRSRYQHAWATAVETVSMFSGQALKSSLGSDEWKRFFSLMGSAIALREGSALVPDTPSNKSELISELLEVATSLQVEHRLSEYNKALHSITSGTQDAYFFLMKLDPVSRTLTVQGFSEKEALVASTKYAEAEEEAKSNPGTDAVLVSVESVGSLAKAYPNYFADTRLFVELLKQALAGRSRSIRVPDLKIGQMNLQFKEQLG
jgi:ppGpp synthetase/RelA/SpoT-type nucleotidyltranferase